MCGIVAVWHRDRSAVDLSALRDAVGALRNRGPDDEGFVLIDTGSGRVVECAGSETAADNPLPRLDDLRGEHFDLALGHRRLAIVDLSSAGHQPMRTAAGATWVVFNGMIYNFPELRDDLQQQGYRFRSGTDTEVLLQAYEAWGEDCVLRFNGSWAFALWDARAQRLFLSRDRFGIKPLVLYASDRLVVAASELKALERLPSVERSLDHEAAHHYFSLMKVPAPWTIYEGVRKVMPGQSLGVTRRGVAERCYWQPGGRPTQSGNANRSLEEVHALLRDSVRLRLRADVPVGALLSGGLDSSLITALAAREHGSSLFTYGIGFPQLPAFDESPWAERVAAHVRARHRSLELCEDVDAVARTIAELCDEPFAVSSILGVSALAQEAARDVKVVLTGDGGDEVFAGYTDRYVGVDRLWEESRGWPIERLSPTRVRLASGLVRWRRPRTWTKAYAALRAVLTPGQRQRDDAFNLVRLIFNDAEKRELYTPEWDAATRGISTLSWLGSRLSEPRPETLRRWQLQDISTSLHDEMLAKVDRATLAWGVEARVPFLDHRLVDLALSLPRHLKVVESRGKQILRQIGAEYLPRAVLQREKQGFGIPLSDWFRGPLRSWVRDVLSSSALQRSGVLRARSVEEVFAYHETNPCFLTAHMIFTLLCFQLWVDGREASGC